MIRKSPCLRGVLLAGVCLLSMVVLPEIALNSEVAAPPTHGIYDWSMAHVIAPQNGPADRMLAAKRDPRAMLIWLNQAGRHYQYKGPAIKGRHRDWSIYLGRSGTAAAQWPAKYGFNISAAPDCVNDFVIFPVNSTGSSTQPNIVAFNQLYSGTTPAGICNRTATNHDTGTSAEVYWSYNIEGIAGGGAVTTSPTLSYDGSGNGGGTKVAFVESGNGAAHFHVLAWKAADGSDPRNLQSVLTPKTINAFVTATPAIGSGTATDLAFGSTTDTLSWPFVDYNTDTAYVGNDAGQLYRIKDVFCIANSDCPSESSGPAPSIDSTWGPGGYVNVCAGKLTAPVYDAVDGIVFVGCSDGKLYAITQNATVSSLQVGNGSTYGGIVDAPSVDIFDGFVYVVSGSGAASDGAKGVLVQASVSNLASNVMVPIGTGGQCNLHDPVPNHAYETSITSSGAAIYVGGVSGTVPACTPTANATGPDLYLYGLTFGANGIIKATPTTSTNEGPGPGYEWAPFTEFYNATEGDDWLLSGTLQDQDNVVSFTLNLNPNKTGGVTQEGMGVTGMVIDNDSSEAQASSFYFTAMGENAACNITSASGVTTNTGGCAVKLTQSTLQ